MTVSRTALILILAGTAVPALADQITCHSSQPRPEPCGTVQPGSSVRLARQLGDRPCIEGRTWGTGPDRDSIWVSSGCSAVFDVQPPGRGGYADEGGGYQDDRGAGAPPDNSRSPEWQRGFADGRRGNADPNANSQDYLEGFRAGEDVARDANRYGARAAPRGPSDNPGVFEPMPNAPPAAPSDRGTAPGDEDPEAYANRGAAPPDQYGAPADRNYPPPRDAYPGSRDDRYASIDQHRSVARQACLHAAAQDRRYGPDRIISREVRWIGHGEFAVSLETPDGELTCTVDRDGNVHSIDDR